jgi:hypothetical protein
MDNYFNFAVFQRISKGTVIWQYDENGMVLGMQACTEPQQ